MNNNIALITILGIFLSIGFISPFIEKDYNTNIGEVDTEGIILDAEASEVGAVEIFFSLVKMFFWTFGSLPTWVDALIFVPLRIWFIVLFVDKIRGIGS